MGERKKYVQSAVSVCLGHSRNANIICLERHVTYQPDHIPAHVPQHMFCPTNCPPRTSDCLGGPVATLPEETADVYAADERHWTFGVHAWGPSVLTRGRIVFISIVRVDIFLVSIVRVDEVICKHSWIVPINAHKTPDNIAHHALPRSALQ